MNVVKPTKLPIWERTKKEKRRERLIKFIVGAILLVIIVNLVIKLPGIYRELNTPFPRLQGDIDRKEELDTSFRTNILLISHEDKRVVDLAIVSYEPVDKRLTALLFNLPEFKNMRLTINKAFRNSGEAGLQNLLSVSLAVPIDRYLAFEDPDLTFMAEDLENAAKEIKSAGAIFQAFSAKRNLNNILRTNFTTSELLKIGWMLRDTRYEEKDNFQLSEKDVKDLRTEEIGSLINNLLFDRKILDEGASMSIVNSSESAGVGSVLASYIRNLGGSVIDVESGDEIESDSSIVVKNEKSEITKRLKSIIGFKKKKATEKEEFSGDLLFIIGKDAADELTFP